MSFVFEYFGWPDRLRELGTVLADVRERRGADPLEGELRLLEAEHEERHGSRVHDRLGQLLRVPRDVSEGLCLVELRICLTVELPFGKLFGTRSRLYRSRFLQVTESS